MRLRFSRVMTWSRARLTTSCNTILKTAVEKVNDGLPSYKHVTKVVVRKTPFDKTTSGKIRRKYN